MAAKKTSLILSLIILIISICGTAMAATPAEINNAIVKGVTWLAAQQNSTDGYWEDAGYQAGPTGLALIKLQERAFELGYTPFDPCYPYKQNVEKGLAYLFSQMSIIPISTQLHGNPDSEGDGNGVSVHSLTYETGIAMMAIAASRAPDRIVNSPGSPVNGWTYKKVLQNMVDYMAFGQNDSGNGRGGWIYDAVDNGNGEEGSDNSNSGYAVSGLGYAESCVYGFKCTVPQFVKDELKIWIDYIQTDGGDNDGGSGYNGPNDWVNILKTGNLVFQMTFAGMNSNDPNFQRALAYIGRKWNDSSQDPGWGNPAYGSSPRCQAVYCTSNGFWYSNINTIVVGGNQRDWYADFADALVNTQQTAGCWPTETLGGPVLATEWALLTLEMKNSGPLPSGRLELTKVDDVNNGDCVRPGRQITYTIDYNYPGSCGPDINDVNIIDYLPPEVDFVSASNSGVYDSGSRTVTWHIGTLHLGDSGSVTLKVNVKPCVEPGITITNYCEIKSGEKVLNIAYEYTPVCCPTLTKVDNINGYVSPGETITYSICYAANGYGDTNVVITDTIPPEVNFVSATGGGMYNSGKVTWDIGTLEPNESGCFELVVQVNTKAEPGSTITNCSQMSGDCIHNINACENTTPVRCWGIPVIYVDANATGAHNGTSWADAYKYLQDALRLAQTLGCPSKEIWVAAGTYKPDCNSVEPNGSGDRNATFSLINNVAIYGGFPPGGGSWQTRNPNTYKSILSGNINAPDVNTDNSYHVVTGSDTNETAVLDGFTITAGNADGDYPYGGGMYNNSGNPTVTKCTFSGNRANSGGGMYNNGDSPTVTNCTFNGNRANSGSGMYNNGSCSTITNCTFSGNSADSGGGMYNDSGGPIVTNCLLSENLASKGGGLYNNSSGPIVTNCTFTKNVADANGGGIYNYNGSPTIANCILWDNNAPSGKQIYNSSSNLTVTHSDVQGCWAGTGNICDNPYFVAAGNYRLLCGSPCIDAGDNNSVPPDYADLDGDGNTTEPTPLDLGGLPRFIPASDARAAWNPNTNRGKAQPWNPNTDSNFTFDLDFQSNTSSTRTWTSKPSGIDALYADVWDMNTAGYKIWNNAGGIRDTYADFRQTNDNQPDPNRPYGYVMNDVRIKYKDALDGSSGQAVWQLGLPKFKHTFAFWFYTPDVNQGTMIQHKFYLQGSDPAYADRWWEIRIENGKLHFYHKAGYLRMKTVNTLANLGVTANTWHHVSMVIDRTLLHNSKIYVDGLEAQVLYTAYNGDPAADASIDDGTESPQTYPSRIQFGGGTDTNGYDFDGRLDEIRVYNRALNPIEASILYQWDPNVVHPIALLPIPRSLNVAIATDVNWVPATGATAQSVYFGTDPYNFGFPKATGNGSLNMVSNVTLGGPFVFNTKYYWRVDSTIGGNVVTGPLWYFTTVNSSLILPIVDMGAYEFLRSGDINYDGVVNFVDFALFAKHWRQTNCGKCGGADLTGDGQVNLVDLYEFAEWWLAGTAF